MNKIKGFKERIDDKEIFAGQHIDKDGNRGILVQITEKMEEDIPAVNHQYNEKTGIRTTTLFISVPTFHFVNNVILTQYIEEDERSIN